MKKMLEIQLKVPVCLTITLSLEDAERMLKRELCEVVDCILEVYQHDTPRSVCARTAGLRPIYAEWNLAPHWDHLPDDECELYMTEHGLFPEDNGDDE